MQKKGNWIKYLPLVAIALMIVLFGTTLRHISMEDILSLKPDSFLLSALLLVGLYALKSISVVFPLLVLYISVGAIFPVPIALLVNGVGLFVCISIPYFIGRFSGRDVVARLVAKYPKAEQISEFTSRNAVFASYVLRIINLLPGDVVSMVLGASEMPFHQYAVGSLFGLLPVMVPASLAGRSIENPFSMEFLLPFVITIVVSLASTFLYNRWQKSSQTSKNQHSGGR